MMIGADGLLFDSDGVLVDSHLMVEAAWRTLAAEYGLDIDVLLAELAGVRAIDTLSKYLTGSDLHTAIAELDRIEIANAGQTVAIPGARELLRSLPAGTFAFVTSASEALAHARWVGAGISVPPQRITADQVAQGKPNPEPFLKGASLLGVDPSQCVVFEDSPSGGLAARAAGARVVAVGDVAWPFEPDARVPDLRSVTVVEANGQLRIDVAV